MAANSTKSASKKRGPGRPFAKGRSGNPSGRPKSDPNLRAAAQAHTEEAINVLAEIMRNTDAPPAARVAAANAILDRGHGKPAQSLALSGEGGGPIMLAWQS